MLTLSYPCSLLSIGLDPVLGHGTLDDGLHRHGVRVYCLLSQGGLGLVWGSTSALPHPCNASRGTEHTKSSSEWK